MNQPATTNPNEIHQTAISAWHNNLCPIPAANDGTKRPFAAWKTYQTVRPTLEQINQWFTQPHQGLGLITGAISGNLEMLEFEGRAVEEGLIDRWITACDQAGIGPLLDTVIDGYTENTPSGGVHILLRTTGPTRPNLKLARRHHNGETQVLIETRGEGGFTIIAPSHGTTHPNGKPWTHNNGTLATIATITPQQRDELYDAARSLDELPDKVTPIGPPLTLADYNHTGPSWIDQTVNELARTPWSTILGKYGLQHHHDTGDVAYWVRPGKDPQHGHSATTNAKGTDRLIVFSSSMPLEPYDGNGPAPSYDRLDVIAAYEHAGDRVAAAKQLNPTHTQVPNHTRTNQELNDPPQHTLPDEFWQTRPELNHIRQAALSRLISPDGVLGAVLARVVALTHHTLTIPEIIGRIASPDLFIGNIAPPGVGKGASMDQAAQLIPSPGLMSWLAGRFIEAPIGSGEGIIKVFFDTTSDIDPATGKPIRTQKQVAYNALLRIDEIEQLERLSNRRDQTTMTVLRSAWSRETLGAAYSDDIKDRRLQPGSYRLGVVMGIQPSAAAFLLADTGTGTPQRFTFVSGTHPAITDTNIPQHPGRLTWKPTGASGDQIDVAEPICTELRARHIAAVTGNNADPMNAHAGLRQLKIAVALALLASRTNVTAQDWELAQQITDNSDRLRTTITSDIARQNREREQAFDQRAGKRRTYELEAEDAQTERRIKQGADVLVNRLTRVGEPMVWRELRDALGRYKRDAVAIRDWAVDHGLITTDDEGRWVACKLRG